MNKKILYTVFLFTVITSPFFVCAQGTVGVPNQNSSGGTPTNVSVDLTVNNPFRGGSDLSSIIATILTSIIDPIATVVVVIAIIFAGFKYVTAQGNPKAIQDANQALLYVLIGTAVLLGATGIADAIHGTVCGPLISC